MERLGGYLDEGENRFNSLQLNKKNSLVAEPGEQAPGRERVS